MKNRCNGSPHNGLNCGAYILRLGKVVEAVKSEFEKEDLNVPENLVELIKKEIEPILKKSESLGCWSGKIKGLDSNKKEMKTLFENIKRDLKQT